MAAGHYGLDNLVFVIDYNKVEAKGFISQDMSLEPLADKLRAFNLDVHETRNGHDVAELVDLFNRARLAATRQAERDHPQHGQGQEGPRVPSSTRTGTPRRPQRRGRRAVDRRAMGAGWPAARDSSGVSGGPQAAIEIVPPVHGAAGPDHRPAAVGVGDGAVHPARPADQQGDALPDGLSRSPTWRPSTRRSSPSTPTSEARPASTSSSTSIRPNSSRRASPSRTCSRMAAGLSQEGYIAFPCTFDAFSRRFLDQLYVTVAYSNLNVKVLGAYAGLFTGKAGATHQSDKELGTIVLRIPRLTVIEPGCNLEMRQALRVAAETQGPFYLRIVRCEVEENEIFEGYQFRVGKGVTVSGDAARCRARVDRLHAPHGAPRRREAAGRGIGVRHDHHPSLKPFDRELLYDMAVASSVLDHAREPLHERRPAFAGGRSTCRKRHRGSASARSAATPRISSIPATSTTCCGGIACRPTTSCALRSACSGRASAAGLMRRGCRRPVRDTQRTDLASDR